MAAFNHPLVRDAKIWASGGLSGPPRPVLVVITGISLSPEDRRYKPKSVERLTTAVKDWIAEHPEEASDFILMNRPKTWAGDKAG